jgi:hypothetical protein
MNLQLENMKKADLIQMLLVLEAELQRERLEDGSEASTTPQIIPNVADFNTTTAASVHADGVFSELWHPSQKQSEHADYR